MAILMKNRLELCGRLCADPELKATATGVPCTTVTLAVQRPYKNSDGKRDTDFFQIDLYKHHAEYVCRYLKKGQSLWIDASIRTKWYLDPVHGDRRFTIEIVVNSVDGVDSPRKEQEGSFDADEFFNAALQRSYSMMNDE